MSLATEDATVPWSESDEWPSRGASHDARAPETLPPGTSVGRYVVGELLGSGAMGAVYEAYDPELDRTVAVKVMRSDAVGSDVPPESLQAALLREALALAKLAHPNVVTIHDAGIYEGRVFLAMEHIRGLTLGAWAASPRRQWREILRALIDAGRGLAAAHAIGLVHRDFKPGNVLVDEQGRAAVLDFGLVQGLDERRPLAAPRLDTSGASRAGSEFSLAGTPQYMSPEQHRGETVDARSDQFSFCVTAYHVLCGVRPFAGPVEDLAGQIQQGEFQASTRGKLPRRVIDVLTRGMAYDAAVRHDSMSDLLAALERVLIARRRTGMAVVASTLVAGGLGFVFASWHAANSLPSACDRVESLHASWTDDIRDRLEAGFVATAQSFAHDAATRVTASLDRYHQQHDELATSACEATFVTQDRPVEVYERQIECLRRAGVAFEALVQRFIDPDATTVERSIAAVATLPELDACGDVAAVRRIALLPTEPDLVETVTHLQRVAARARATEVTGDAEAALAHLEPVLATAEATELWPLVAELEHIHALALRTLGRRDEARVALTTAMEAAYRSSDDLRVARLIALLQYLLLDEALYDEARRWERLGNGALARSEAPPRHVVRLRLATAAVALAEHNNDRATTLLTDAIAQLGPGVEYDSVRIAALSHLAVTHIRAQRLAEGEAALREALPLAEKTYGASHPVLVSLEMNLGVAAAKQGYLERSYQHHERAYQLLSANDPNGLRTLLAKYNALSISLQRCDPEAVAPHVAGVHQRMMNEFPGTRYAVFARLGHALQLRLSGRTAEARDVLEIALADIAKNHDSDPSASFDPRSELARGRLADGDAAGAFADIQSLLKHAQELWGEDDTRLHSLEYTAGLLAMSAGQWSYARRSFDSARRRVESVVGDTPVLVESLAALATLAVREGDLDAAQQWLTRAEQAKGDEVLPPHPQARLLVVRAHLDPHAPAGAMAQARRLTSRCREPAADLESLLKRKPAFPPG